MAFTLWNFFEASILILNAICVLHEERFLAKIGWGINRQNMQGFGEEPTVKLQIMNLVRSIRTVARSAGLKWITSLFSYWTLIQGLIQVYLTNKNWILNKFNFYYVSHRLTKNFLCIGLINTCKLIYCLYLST